MASSEAALALVREAEIIRPVMCIPVTTYMSVVRSEWRESTINFDTITQSAVLEIE